MRHGQHRQAGRRDRRRPPRRSAGAVAGTTRRFPGCKRSARARAASRDSPGAARTRQSSRGPPADQAGAELLDRQPGQLAGHVERHSAPDHHLEARRQAADDRGADPEPQIRSDLRPGPVSSTIWISRREHGHDPRERHRHRAITAEHLGPSQLQADLGDLSQCSRSSIDIYLDVPHPPTPRSA